MTKNPHEHPVNGHLACPPSRRGHVWREPDLTKLPETPRRDLALRVCRRCGAIGRVNSQGVVFVEVK